MRVSEFIHFLNRKDIGLGVNPPVRDYTHFAPRMLAKRARYEHQMHLRQIEKEKKDDKTIKNSRRSSRKDK